MRLAQVRQAAEAEILRREMDIAEQRERLARQEVEAAERISREEEAVEERRREVEAEKEKAREAEVQKGKGKEIDGEAPKYGYVTVSLPEPRKV